MNTNDGAILGGEKSDDTLNHFDTMQKCVNTERKLRLLKSQLKRPSTADRQRSRNAQNQSSRS